jgi:peptidoglycan hydrolase-like protein with peptidoglycan-binding domain
MLLLVSGSWAQTQHAKAKSTHAKPVVHKKSSTHSKATVRRAKYTRHSKRYRSRKPRGQQAISDNRAREIQEALIREHYLQGEPSGAFDARTKAALMKYQHDNGWQTRVVPDSRALIKLGLGPSHDGLLNPESAAIGNPDELGMQKAIQTQADEHK